MVPPTISIHALLAESDVFNLGGQDITVISIHALLAESDGNIGSAVMVPPTISIHALLAESDPLPWLAILRPKLFLSTLSLRRATAYTTTITIYTVSFLSTLSLRRATNDAINGCNPDFISIHALLAESDYDTYAKVLRVNISIHALLAESDIDVNNPVFSVTSISIHALLAESDALLIPRMDRR